MSKLEQINLNDQVYTMEISSEGDAKIKRYNHQHKMWVTLNFPSSRPTEDTQLIQLLKEESLKQRIQEINLAS